MDRTHKFKGTKFEKPLTAEDNRREMEMERSEFMYDPKIGLSGAFSTSCLRFILKGFFIDDCLSIGRSASSVFLNLI